MNKIIPYMGPDAFRKFLKLNKSLYDSHTSKNINRENLSGIQYYGTVDNFGSELLIESRKLFLDKFPLKRLLSSNASFYFNIEYTNMIDTFEQQNLLYVSPKKDTFVSSKNYSLILESCEKIYVPRAIYDSNSDVKKQVFYKLDPSYNPQLKIDDNVSDISFLNNNTMSASYYFLEDRIYSLDVTITETNDNKYHIEIPLNNREDIPCLWISYSGFNRILSIISGQTDIHNRQLLTCGTDGHDNSYLYPMICNENIPEVIDEDTDGSWFIKAYTRSNEDAFSVDINKINNYDINIYKISYVFSTSINSEPIASYDLNIDDNVKVTLNSNINWMFKKPQQGDYDFDGITYMNIPYAYIPLHLFSTNTSDDTTLIPAFDVKFNNEKASFFSDTKIFSNNVSGIHIDSSSEYTSHAISKKNGVIHDLGDFDGLPIYFKYLLDKTIHRIHTEIYAIRDNGHINQLPTNKQTAALIFDTAIPNNESSFILDDLNLSIVYNKDIGRMFFVKEEPNDRNNALSEIVFIDENTFGCSSDPKYALNRKFVYHGNRMFSLSKSELDPETQIARVYHISNDPSVYLNNDILPDNQKKPLSTLARICDIPTSYMQLIQIEGKAPSIIIDLDYNRSECNFTLEDKNLIWNNEVLFVTRTFNVNGTNKKTIVFHYQTDLNWFLTKDYLDTEYGKYIQLNEYVDILDTTKCKYDTDGTGTSMGTGYEVDDIVGFKIGGRLIKFKVIEVLTGGYVKKIQSISSRADSTIHSSYLNKYNLFHLETISGSGNGLTMGLEINDATWESLNQKHIPSSTIEYRALKFDVYNNIWVWKYDYQNEQWNVESQLTGKVIYENNLYDEIDTRDKRSLKDVMINNLLNNNCLTDMNERLVFNTFNTSDIPLDEDLNNGTDHSSIFKENYNMSNALYAITHNPDESMSNLQGKVFGLDDNNPLLILPRLHRLHLKKYKNKTNKIGFIPHEDCQTEVFVYNPTKTMFWREENNVIYKDHEITYLDRFNNESENIIDSSGIVKSNIYWMNDFDIPSEIKRLRFNLESAPRQNIIEYIKNNISSDNMILKYENTPYQYSKESLINYIIQNTYKNPLYAKDEISLACTTTHKVFDLVNDKYVPNKEENQPSGGFEKCTDIHHGDVYIDSSLDKSKPLNIFKVEDTSIIDINKFRLLDEYGNDVSESSIIIFGDNAYMYNAQINNWVNIHS